MEINHVLLALPSLLWISALCRIHAIMSCHSVEFSMQFVVMRCQVTYAVNAFVIGRYDILDLDVKQITIYEVMRRSRSSTLRSIQRDLKMSNFGRPL